MTELFGRLGRVWRSLALLCAVSLGTPALAASLDEQLAADAADGTLDETDFLTAALIASGVNDCCELAHWQASYAELKAAALAAIPRASAGTCQRAAALHSALHAHVLIGSYQSQTSDLRTTIARGDYNCLTALAVHWDLCHSAGLPLDICASPGHVRLRAANGDWIEPGAKRGIVSHKSNQAFTRRLTPIELLGKFYYNRGIEQLRSGRFAEGLAELQISLQLDPADDDARENLLAGFNNWAVEHCRQQRYDLAATLIKRGLLMEPGYPPLVANRRLVRERLQPAE